MPWKPIVGKGFTANQFSTYVENLKMGSWKPKFVVVHNTSVPSLATYHRMKIPHEQWMRNLEGYYRDEQRWNAGPHLFVADDLIWVFTPLTGPGTHAPSWNSISWGVETVGEFNIEPFNNGVRDNLVAALATLHLKAKLNPLPYQRGIKGLHFHKEDPKTTHKECPGKNLTKPELISAVQAKMLGLDSPEIADAEEGCDDCHAVPASLLGELEPEETGTDEGEAEPAGSVTVTKTVTTDPVPIASVETTTTGPLPRWVYTFYRLLKSKTQWAATSLGGTGLFAIFGDIHGTTWLALGLMAVIIVLVIYIIIERSKKP